MLRLWFSGALALTIKQFKYRIDLNIACDALLDDGVTFTTASNFWLLRLHWINTAGCDSRGDIGI